MYTISGTDAVVNNKEGQFLSAPALLCSLLPERSTSFDAGHLSMIETAIAKKCGAAYMGSAASRFRGDQRLRNRTSARTGYYARPVSW